MDPLTMDPLTMEANAKQARRDADRLRLQMEAVRAASEPGTGYQASGPSGPSTLRRALGSFRTFRGRPFRGKQPAPPPNGDVSAADRTAANRADVSAEG